MTRHSAIKRYGVAVLAVAAGVVLRLVLMRLLGGRLIYLTFFPAVITAGLLGGLGPGLVAVALLELLQREAPSVFGDYTRVPLSDGGFATHTEHPKV